MTKCRPKDSAMEAINHMLDHGGIFTSDWFSDKLDRTDDAQWKHVRNKRLHQFENAYLFIAFNISMVTSTDKANVIGWGSWKTWQLIPLKSSGLLVQDKWWVWNR